MTHGLWMAGSAEVLADRRDRQGHRHRYCAGVPVSADGRRTREGRYLLPAAPLLAERSRGFMTTAPLPISSSSEQRLEFPRIARGDLEIGAGEPRPLFGCTRPWFEQVRNGEARSQGGPVAPGREKQPGRASSSPRRSAIPLLLWMYSPAQARHRGVRIPASGRRYFIQRIHQYSAGH